MSAVEELLAEHCPHGVRFQALGDFGEFFGGLSGKAKADFAEGNARYVSYVNVFKNSAVDLDTDDRVRVAPSERQRQLRTGDVIFTGSSESAAEVAMSSVVTGAVTQPLYLNSFCIGFRPKDTTMLEPDFAKHLFRSGRLRKALVRTAQGVTRFNVSKQRLATVRIPVPPLQVQREIVAILDKMERLEAELEAELEARRRQYAYYRDALLTFDEAGGIRWVPMGDAGTFLRGKRFTKADYAPDGIACIHYGEIYTHYGTSASEARSHLRSEVAPSLRFAEPGDVVVVDVGETPEDVGKAVAWIGPEPVAIHDHSYAYRSDLDAVFLSHVMQTSWFRRQKLKYVARTKVNTLLVDGFAKISIPVPALAVQKRIASQLDSFDALVNDLSSGLPAEIAARRKQYEYYRDRLLSFEELAA